MLEQLRNSLRALEKPAGIEGGPGCVALGIAGIDAALGGGLARGALHEMRRRARRISPRQPASRWG